MEMEKYSIGNIAKKIIVMSGDYTPCG